MLKRVSWNRNKNIFRHAYLSPDWSTVICHGFARGVWYRVELQRVLCASCWSTRAELYDERNSQHGQPDVGRTVRNVSSASSSFTYLTMLADSTDHPFIFSDLSWWGGIGYKHIFFCFFNSICHVLLLSCSLLAGNIKIGFICLFIHFFVQFPWCCCARCRCSEIADSTRQIQFEVFDRDKPADGKSSGFKQKNFFYFWDVQ